MKTLIKAIFVIALVLPMNFAWAQDLNTEVAVEMTGTQSFFLSMTNSTVETAELSIKAKDYQVLHTEWVRTPEKFERNFHLENLKDGKYQLFIEDEMMIRLLPFRIKNQELVLDPNAWRSYLKSATLASQTN